MAKYELTSETKTVYSAELRRIRYLVDIPVHDIKAGDEGGFLESQVNLSQTGDCVVLDDACVMGKARVSESALVKENALLMHTASAHDHALISGNTLLIGDAVVKDYARLEGNARVRDNVVIQGQAIVKDDADINGWTVIGGRAQVFESASMNMNKLAPDTKGVHVDDRARLYGNAVLAGRCIVRGNAEVFGNAVIKEEVVISDSASVSGDARLHNSSVSGMVKLAGGAHVRNCQLSGSMDIRDSAKLTDCKINANNLSIHKEAVLTHVEMESTKDVTITHHAKIEFSTLIGAKNMWMGDKAQLCGTDKRHQVTVNGSQLIIRGQAFVGAGVVITGDKVELLDYARLVGNILVSQNVVVKEMAHIENIGNPVTRIIDNEQLDMDYSSVYGA